MERGRSDHIAPSLSNLRRDRSVRTSAGAVLHPSEARPDDRVTPQVSHFTFEVRVDSR